MCDYEESSQLKSWLYTPNQLEKCRERANRQARVFLTQAAAPYDHDHDNSSGGDTKQPPPPPPVYSFAAGFAHCKKVMEEEGDHGLPAAQTNANGHSFLTPQEEGLLVAFYASKLPSLIGPMAQVPRLRRDVKVAATSSLLFRRFYLSNSVMLHDPKAVMVAAAFLGSKVDDATSDVCTHVKKSRVYICAFDYIDLCVRYLLLRLARCFLFAGSLSRRGNQTHECSSDCGRDSSR
jgi:cyclin H